MIDRYSRDEIRQIWELENKFRIWLDIEIAACEANAELGIIPAEDLKIIQEKANFDLNRIHEIEAEVHHDVIAFLTSVAEHVGEPSRYIHFGLTSSDIGDTALCIQMKQAGELLIKDVDLLLEALRKKPLNINLHLRWEDLMEFMRNQLLLVLKCCFITKHSNVIEKDSFGQLRI